MKGQAEMRWRDIPGVAVYCLQRVVVVVFGFEVVLSGHGLVICATVYVDGS